MATLVKTAQPAGAGRTYPIKQAQALPARLPLASVMMCVSGKAHRVEYQIYKRREKGMQNSTHEQQSFLSTGVLGVLIVTIW